MPPGGVVETTTTTQEPTMSTTELDITGKRWASCAARVEKRLRRVSSVSSDA